MLVEKLENIQTSGKLFIRMDRTFLIPFVEEFGHIYKLFSTELAFHPRFEKLYSGGEHVNNNQSERHAQDPKRTSSC